MGIKHRVLSLRENTRFSNLHIESREEEDDEEAEEGGEGGDGNIFGTDVSDDEVNVLEYTAFCFPFASITRQLIIVSY